MAAVARQSTRAAETELLNAANDPSLAEAVRLLVLMPSAAGHADFGDGLRSIGLDIRSEPSLFDIITAVTAYLDAAAASTRGRDAAELATRALTGTLMDCVGRELPGLFSPTAEDVRLGFHKLSRSAGMAVFCRTYFGTFVATALSYWLDRELAFHIGAGRRFGGVAERAAFDLALRQHTSEATRIIQEFSGGWVGKRLHDNGTITIADARDFAHVCLKKIVEELTVRRGEVA